MTVADDLRDVTVAAVHKGGRHAAELRRLGSHVEFRLRGGYDGPAVATNLGQDVTGLPAGAVPPFFAGLLPEGGDCRHCAGRSRPRPTTN